MLCVTKFLQGPQNWDGLLVTVVAVGGVASSGLFIGLPSLKEVGHIQPNYLYVKFCDLFLVDLAVFFIASNVAVEWLPLLLHIREAPG
jgi:hypothetical protein